MPKRIKSMGNKKGPQRHGRWTFWQSGTGEGTLKRVMSNADRRRLGMEQDPDLDDFQPDKKSKNEST